MNDRSNDAPGEESADLTDAQLDAATNAAEAEVDEAEAGGESMSEAEAVDDEMAEAELDAEDAAEDAEAEEIATDEGMPPSPPVRVGARQRAAEAAAAREAAAGRAPKARAATRTAFAIDPSLRIKDPASAWFVVGSIAVFLVIFLNAMAFGHGGAFTTVKSPAPIVSQSPGPSVSPGASGSTAPSGSPAASPAPTTAPTAAPSAAPSGSPAAT